MKIAIIGTGAVGGYFGGRLAQAGNEVTFIARGEHLKAIRGKGLEVKSIKGDFKISPANCTDKIEEIENPELILVCVKAWQVKETAEKLKQVINENTVVIPLQNGILAAEELSGFLPKKNVVGGLCRVFSKIESPGVINHMGLDPTIIFGELDKAKSNRTEKLKIIFDEAYITSVLSEEVEAEMWKKFLLICSSGLLAVARSSYGIVRELPETRKMLNELFTEIYDVGIASGVNLTPDTVEKTMKAVDGFDYNATSSLTRDVMEGRPSEIEYQNGTVVRLAEKLGIDVPVNRFVYNCILPMERKAGTTGV